MKHLLTQSVALVSLIILSSCAAAIRSNKSPDFNRKINKFYVIVEVSDNSRTFVPKFQSKFIDLITERGVRAEFETLDPLSLATPEDLRAQIQDSGADALMIVSQTESVTVTNSNSFYFGGERAAAGTFDIKIFEVGNERPVWRGNMKSSSSGYGNIGSVAKKSAKTLIGKLIEDGMI